MENCGKKLREDRFTDLRNTGRQRAIAEMIIQAMAPLLLARPLGIWVALALLSSGAQLWAATQTVTNTSDAGPGSLRNAISDANAGDTIVFDPALDGATIVLMSGMTLVIDKDLTIDGSALVNPVTLSGDANQDAANSIGDTGIISATTDADSLVLRHLIFQRGLPDPNTFTSGGAISCEADTLTVEHCHFSFNRSPWGAGAIQAIRLHVNASIFIQNRGDNNGGPGAIRAGTVELRNCVFSQNRGDVGGAVSANQLSAFDCTFVQNIADHDGGAIAHIGGGLLVERCVFESNRCNSLISLFQGRGGGINSQDSAQVLVRNCRFLNNSNRGTYGGGASFETLEARIEGSFFSGNSSIFGGGVYIDDSRHSIISHSTFVRNHGGAVHASAGFSILSSTIFQNRDYGIHTPSIGIIGNSIVAENGPTGQENVDLGAPRSTIISSLVGVEPFLSPPGMHGGPVPTLVPLPGSPAIDAGNSSLLLADGDDLDNDGDTTEPQPYDKRGFPRISGTALDIGSVESVQTRDLPLVFAADGDGDGVPTGVEIALGTDGGSPLLESPKRFRLQMDSASQIPKLTLGLNPDALPFTSWIVRRSTTLLPSGWTEIYRYHGPTMTGTSDGATATPIGDLLEVVDNDAPPTGPVFYQLEAIPHP